MRNMVGFRTMFDREAAVYETAARKQLYFMACCAAAAMSLTDRP
jgi:hypothetical protein